MKVLFSILVWIFTICVQGNDCLKTWYWEWYGLISSKWFNRRFWIPYILWYLYYTYFEAQNVTYLLMFLIQIYVLSWNFLLFPKSRARVRCRIMLIYSSREHNPRQTHLFPIKILNWTKGFFHYSSLNNL